jgi:hypothetical protein
MMMADFLRSARTRFELLVGSTDGADVGTTVGE